MSILHEETLPAGAVPSPLALTDAEVGRTLRLEVRAQNANGSTTAVSIPFGPIRAAPVVTTYPASLIFDFRTDVDVQIIAQTATTVTLGWSSVADAYGFMFLIDGQEWFPDGKRHFTFDGARTSVKIGRPQDGREHSYGVLALRGAGGGEVRL